MNGARITIGPWAAAGAWVVVGLTGATVGLVGVAFPYLIATGSEGPTAAATGLLLMFCGAVLAALGRVRCAAQVRTLRGLPLRARPESPHQLSRAESSALGVVAAVLAAVVLTLWPYWT